MNNKRAWMKKFREHGWTKVEANKIVSDLGAILEEVMARPGPQPIRLGNIGVLVPGVHPGRTVANNVTNEKYHIGQRIVFKFRMFKEFRVRSARKWFPAKGNPDWVLK